MKKRTRSVAIAALFLLGTFGLVTEAQGNKKITFLSVVQEDLGISAVITSVTKDYQKTNPNVSYEFQYIAQNDLVPKLELLTASDNLPTLYNVGDPVTVQQLATKGYVADIEATFKKLGIWDRVNPAAAAVVKSQYYKRSMSTPWCATLTSSGGVGLNAQIL